MNVITSCMAKLLLFWQLVQLQIVLVRVSSTSAFSPSFHDVQGRELTHELGSPELIQELQRRHLSQFYTGSAVYDHATASTRSSSWAAGNRLIIYRGAEEEEEDHELLRLRLLADQDMDMDADVHVDDPAIADQRQRHVNAVLQELEMEVLRRRLPAEAEDQHSRSDYNGQQLLKDGPRLISDYSFNGGGGGNYRLHLAYWALQAWRHCIFSDPYNVLSTWHGADVCSYFGVFCAPAPDDPHMLTVAGIDLNHADLAGFLPEELGLLADLALFHLNSNRFCGKVPLSFSRLYLLFELDLSNNRFVGRFPSCILSLPILHYLDIRFNDFEGPLPPSLFNHTNVDAVFLNSNRFTGTIPTTISYSLASVIVLANNKLDGCLPSMIGNAGSNLNEIILLNNNLTGCIPPSIGMLTNLTVLDISFNQLTGPLPSTIGNMVSLEQLNIAHNLLIGQIPREICSLLNLQSFDASFDLFTEESPRCLALDCLGIFFDDEFNCIKKANSTQRSSADCASALNHTKGCDEFACGLTTEQQLYKLFPTLSSWFLSSFTLPFASLPSQ